MNIYLAARFSKRDRMRMVRADLKVIGHTVTSRWIDRDQDDQDVVLTRGWEAEQYASEDILDLEGSELVIVFTEPERIATHGGKHFEMGYAMGLGIPVLLVGEPENIFSFIADFGVESVDLVVKAVTDIEELL